ncbi:MAG: hypothetical protein HZB43_08085 [candidate division Zixibacteria bacterium]|nr:hypothetical protein [candidate division Zixibacteria bacterium]
MNRHPLLVSMIVLTTIAVSALAVYLVVVYPDVDASQFGYSLLGIMIALLFYFMSVRNSTVTVEKNSRWIVESSERQHLDLTRAVEDAGAQLRQLVMTTTNPVANDLRALTQSATDIATTLGAATAGIGSIDRQLAIAVTQLKDITANEGRITSDCQIRLTEFRRACQADHHETRDRLSELSS